MGNDRFRAQQQAQQFQQQQAARQQAINEMLMQRQQPLSELGQILGLAGNVGQPQFMPTPQYGPQTVPYGQYAMNQYNQQLAAHQAHQQNLFGLSGGLGSALTFGLLG